MLKLIKIGLGFLITLLLVLLVAIVVLPKMIDPNDYRQTIVDLVKEKTNRDLAINGDLSISVFPWLGVKTQSLSLSQPTAIGGEMLSVKEAQLKLRLLPLLKKKIEVDAVVLKSPHIRFVTLRSGENSLSGLTSETESQEQENSSPSEFSFDVQSIDISDAHLHYVDQTQQQDYQIEKLNIQAGDLFQSSLASLAINGRFIDQSDGQKSTIDFDIEAKAKVDLKRSKIEVGDLQAKVTLPEIDVMSQVQSLTFDMQKQQAMIEQIKNTITIENQDSRMQAQAEIGRVEADLSSQLFNAKEIQLDTKYDNIPANIEVAKLTVDLNKGSVTVPMLQIKSHDLMANLKQMSIKNLTELPKLSAMLEVAPFNAREWLENASIDYQPSGGNALSNVHLKANIDASLDNLSLNNIRYQMDKSKIDGDLAIDNFEKPNIQFSFNLDQINLDDYLTDSSQEQNSQSTELAQEDLEIPLDAFENISANGQFKAKNMVMSGLSMSDVNITAKTENNVLKITPTAKLYDGDFAGQVIFSDKEKGKQLRVKQKIDLVDLGKMLVDADITEQLSGLGSIDLDIVFQQGKAGQSNTGTIKIFAKDGHIKGVDVQKMIEQAYTQFGGAKEKQEQTSVEKGEKTKEATGVSSEQDKTQYGELIGEFQLTNWVLKNTKFNLLSPLLKVTGKGDIDIAKQQLSYLVEASLINQTNAQDLPYINDLQGVAIPIKLTGALTAPDYSLDISTLTKALLKSRLKKEKNKYIKEKLGGDIEEDASTKDILKQSLIKDIDKKSEKRKARQAQEGELTEEQKRKQKKREEKDELKKKLLESLFD